MRSQQKESKTPHLVNGEREHRLQFLGEVLSLCFGMAFLPDPQKNGKINQTLKFFVQKWQRFRGAQPGASENHFHHPHHPWDDCIFTYMNNFR